MAQSTSQTVSEAGHYDTQHLDQNGNPIWIAPAGQAPPMGAMYSGRPDIAATDFLRQQGIDPANHSIFADILRGIATKLAPTVAMTTGMSGGPGAMDQLANLPGMLRDLLYGNGGQMGQNLATYGQGVLGGLNSPMAGGGATTVASNLGTDVLNKLLASISALRTMGMNPYLQEAYGNQVQAGIANANSADLNSGGHFNAANWWAGNDPYGIFGLKTSPNMPGGGMGAPPAPIPGQSRY